MPRCKKTSENNIPPQTELDLQRLQELYIQDKSNKKVSDEFFILIRTYARSLALKEIKRKGIFLPPERVDEIATDATISLMNQYNKEGWKIMASFGGILYWKILEATYKQADDDQTSSLNLSFTEDKDSKELLDIVGTNACLPWHVSVGGDIDKDNPEDCLIDDINVAYSEISDVIDEAFDILPYKTFMRFLPWLVLQVRKPKTRNIQQLFKNTYLTTQEENSFDILLLEIYNRISQHVY